MGENKKRLRKLILYISLLPYLYFLIMGIINSTTYLITNNVFDVGELLEPIGNFWINNFVSLDIFVVILFIFCVGYPIYYFISKEKKNIIENNSSIDNSEQERMPKLYILYLISFIPYLWLVIVSILGSNLCFFTCSYEYGFAAVLWYIVIFTLIPIYPICLIFQIIYTKVKYKTFSNKMKKITKTIILVLLSLIVIPALLHLINEKLEVNDTYNNDKPIIKKYLEEKYGSWSIEMKISKPYSENSCYSIDTPLLDYNFSICMDQMHENIDTDSFISEFDKQINKNNEIGSYLNKLHNLPDNFKINASLNDIDMTKYDGKVESLITNDNYNIISYYIYLDSYVSEDVINLLVGFYKNYDEKLHNYYENSGFDNIESINFYISLDDGKSWYASIQAIKNLKANKLDLHFRGYSKNESKTIEDSEVNIDINEWQILD